MGGPIVGYFAEQYPDTTKSISLIAPAGFQQAMPELIVGPLNQSLENGFGMLNNRIYGVGRMSETAYSESFVY